VSHGVTDRHYRSNRFNLADLLPYLPYVLPIASCIHQRDLIEDTLHLESTNLLPVVPVTTGLVYGGPKYSVVDEEPRKVS
jgi:hypothetical protein